MKLNLPLALRWGNGRLYWIGHTETEDIYVDAETYQRCMKDSLANQGIEHKTWSEYLRQAEAAWEHQCRAEQRLCHDLDFWRQTTGVHIVPRKK